jgi:xyloglucan fucosyltransferase
MKVPRIKSFKLKCLVIIILIIYLLYTFREKLFAISPCTHLYNVNSFQTCAVSNKNCNITILINSYLAYRRCVIEHSSSHADYVVFDAVNGLGNRILGLIAVTTYAIVTSRVLLINWQPGDNHQAYFEDLFLPLSSSDKIPFYYEYSLSRLTNLVKNRWINQIESKRKPNRIPSDWAFYFDREILCNDKTYNQSWFVRFGFYILNFIGHHVKWIRTDQYFVPLLTRNEKTRQTFHTLFQHGQVFAELATRLLHPIPKVNSIIGDYLTKYTLKNKIVTIGVHMRSWSSSMTDHIEPFQKCIEYVIQNVSR